jgi:hypothetical protein
MCIPSVIETSGHGRKKTRRFANTMYAILEGSNMYMQNRRKLNMVT